MASRKADTKRQLQIMRELGITPPNILSEKAKASDRIREATEGFFKYPHWMKPYPDPSAHPMRYRPSYQPSQTKQLTIFCEKCGGTGCGPTSVRIDENHYCVDGMKLDRTQTWRMKHIHTISEDKERTTATFLPAILMLHRAFNLDIANADVRKYTPVVPGGPVRSHTGAKE